jgi:hypothetical protein
MAKYLIYRYGSNAANQHLTPKMPVAVVEAESHEEAVQAVYDYDNERIVDRLTESLTVYNNQYLTAKEYAKLTKKEREELEACL